MTANNTLPAAERVQVEAKVNYGPMMLTTAIMTGLTVGATIFFVRYLDKLKTKEAIDEKREFDEQTHVNPPPVPMLWPGSRPAQQQDATTKTLASIADRLSDWERSLRDRQQTLEQRDSHLHLVMGGDD